MPDGKRHINCDICVVGAGPVGSYLSYLLSKLGYKVTLVEEHFRVGKPVQCAGLVNNRLFDLDGLNRTEKESVLHDIYGANVYSPSGVYLPLRSREVKAKVIDRSRFDKSIFMQAVGEGMEPLLGHSVSELSSVNGRPRVTALSGSGKIEISSDIVVGSDGAGSTVRRLMKLPSPRENVPGINGEFCIKNEGPQDIVGVFTGSEIAPGFFSWAIPSGDPHTFRLGLSTTGTKEFMPHFRRFLESKVISHFLGIKKGKQLPSVSLSFGTLPMGIPDKIRKGNVVLIGDSAGMAKPTSGGGIFPGMMAARDLSMEIDITGEPNNMALDSFISNWKKGYGKELEMSLILRKMVSDVKDKEIDLVIGKLKDDKILDFINEEGDIDKPFQLAMELLMRKPSIMYLIPRFIPLMLKIKGMGH